MLPKARLQPTHARKARSVYLLRSRLRVFSSDNLINCHRPRPHQTNLRLPLLTVLPQCERRVLQQRRLSHLQRITLPQASTLSFTFCFCFCFCGSKPCHVPQATWKTSLCLRPAEIWGEDDVSLKRRCNTVSHVAHVAGSVWQRLLGARVHDMTRCQLDTVRLVLAADCSCCHATSVLCVVLHVSIVSTMQTKAGSDAVFPHQPVAHCPCFIVACGDYTTCAGMFAAASWSVHPEATVNAMRHALLNRAHH